MSHGLPPARCLRRGESGWPVRMEHLQRAERPASLWLRGVLPPPDSRMVAVVGSRHPSHVGRSIAAEIGTALASAGIVVVSGMARGIDAAAHLGALNGAGLTVAVLGCGIDVCYPPEHQALRAQIAEHGCLVSEDAGETAPLGWRFPRRNRLIAAFVEAVIVVEAGARSGALSTARRAADLGRAILAVPGSIRNPTAAGVNLLIRDGARPYLSIDDLFEEVPGLGRAGQLELPDPDTAGGRAMGLEGPHGFLAGRVLQEMGTDPVHPDVLAATLGVASSELAATLTMLQLGGSIVEVCGGRVARTL